MRMNEVIRHSNAFSKIDYVYKTAKLESNSWHSQGQPTGPNTRNPIYT